MKGKKEDTDPRVLFLMAMKRLKNNENLNKKVQDKKSSSSIFSTNFSPVSDFDSDNKPK